MSEQWSVTPMADVRDVHTVSVHRGLVVAAGPKQLLRIRAGSLTVGLRETPLAGTIKLVAIDPAPSSRRYAVATDATIAIFDDSNPGGFLSIPVDNAQQTPSAIAWGKVDGETLLHIEAMEHFYRDGYNLEVPLPRVVTIANDHGGRLGAAIARDEEDDSEFPAGFYVSDDGESWNWRTMPELETIASAFFIALAGDVAAVSIQAGSPHSGVWVSREAADPFEQLSKDEYTGAIAVDDDGVVFVVSGEQNAERVLRFDPASNEPTCIAHLRGKGKRIAALAWDASRKTLWAASPSDGLLAIKAPGKEVVLS